MEGSKLIIIRKTHSWTEREICGSIPLDLITHASVKTILLIRVSG